MAETTNAVVDDLRAAHPNVTISMVDDSVFYTYGNYEAAIHTLLEGARFWLCWWSLPSCATGAPR